MSKSAWAMIAVVELALFTLKESGINPIWQNVYVHFKNYQTWPDFIEPFIVSALRRSV
jgi:hypothetical protein